jgi:hypothetical protein
MQNFIKEWCIASWSTFIGFVQLRSALEIFPCCTIMLPPTKLQVFANFWPKKMLQPFITPQFSPDLSPPDYFRFPKLKMKLKGLHFTDVAEIEEAHNWWIKEGPKKRNFRQLFRNCTTAQKPVYMPMKLILNTRKVCVFLMRLRFLKKSVLKLLDCTV